MPVRPALSALLGLLAAGTAPAADGPRKPNVLLVVADDLGYADLGLHGSTEIRTPHLDALGRGGVVFTNAYVSAPVCSPSRAGFLTGRYQTRFGHEFNPALPKFGGAAQGLPAGETTVADRLKAAGYRTGLLGKWHQGEGPAFHPLARGFDEFFGFMSLGHSYLEPDDPAYGPVYRDRERAAFTGYLTDVLADEACAFVDRNKAGPWFLYLAFNAVHTPMEAPPADVAAFAAEPDPTRRTYLAMLARLDAAVGRVVAKVREAGLENDTLVIFFSDNGGPIAKFAPNGARNGRLRGSKGDTWEGGIRVPFLVRWPGKVPAGGRFDRPVISLDATATALAAAGVEPRPEWKLDGVNLLPHLTGAAAAPPHEALFWRFGPQMAVRVGDWKLVKATLSAEVHFTDTPPRPMLFNLKDDVGETTDLAAKLPDKVRELQAAWDKWDAGNAAPAWPATLRGQKVELK
jgi:arylsulfatase A-like enzyme